MLPGNKYKEKNQYSTKPYYDPISMEIDATFRKSSSQRKRLPPQKNKTRGNCYNYSTPGHFIKDYRKLKKPSTPLMKRMYAAVLKAPPLPEPLKHDMMSWTACYDDSYMTHYSDKSGSGWFPQQLKKLPQVIAGLGKKTSKPTLKEDVSLEEEQQQALKGVFKYTSFSPIKEGEKQTVQIKKSVKPVWEDDSDTQTSGVHDTIKEKVEELYDKPRKKQKGAALPSQLNDSELHTDELQLSFFQEWDLFVKPLFLHLNLLFLNLKLLLQSRQCSLFLT